MNHESSDTKKIGTGDIAMQKAAKRRLAEMEKRNRCLLEALPDMIFVFDEHGTYRDYQAPDPTLLATSPESLVGQTVSDILPQDIADRFLPVIKDVLKTQRLRLFEYSLDLKDGRQQYFEARIMPMDKKNVMTLVRDVTEMRQSTQSLRQYKLLFEKADICIAIATPDGILTSVNDAMANAHGYSAAELIGQHCRIFHNEKQIPALQKNLDRLLRQGSLNAQTSHHCRRDGSEFVMLMTAFVMHNEEGQPSALAATAMNLSDLKKAEAANIQMTAAIEQADEILLLTDKEGIITYVNPAFERITGYTREEAVGKHTRLLKSGKQDDVFYQKPWQTITAGRVWKGIMINRRKDGTTYTESDSISPVRDENGDIVGFVAAKKDISDQVEREEQLRQAQKLESVGRLAGGVAHDFNNMLQVILGSAELALSDSNLTASLRVELEEILGAARQSREITRQLLAFARKEAITPHALDLNTAIDDLLVMLRHLISENIDLRWQPGTNLWPVFMDPSQIDQILTNLVINARDAIPDVGRITIASANTKISEAESKTTEGACAGDYVRLTVSDNGRGIDRETMQHVFEPFFTTKKDGQGTGLGLPTVYGIIRQNAGFVTIKSAPGQGTKVNLFIPRHYGDVAQRQRATTTDRGSGKKGTETVLLVEDEPSVLNHTKRILDRLGYHVLPAETVEEAMRLAQTHEGTIDLLLTDVIMPTMNGTDLADRVQALRAGIKCLYMSGYTADYITDHGVLNSNVHFIQKPFSLSDLSAKVRMILDN